MLITLTISNDAGTAAYAIDISDAQLLQMQAGLVYRARKANDCGLTMMGTSLENLIITIEKAHEKCM